MSFCRFPEDFAVFRKIFLYIRLSGIRARISLTDMQRSRWSGMRRSLEDRTAPPPHGGSCDAGFPSDISCAERLLFSPPDIPSRPFLLALQLETVGDHGDEL